MYQFFFFSSFNVNVSIQSHSAVYSARQFVFLKLAIEIVKWTFELKLQYVVGKCVLLTIQMVKPVTVCFFFLPNHFGQRGWWWQMFVWFLTDDVLLLTTTEPVITNPPRSVEVNSTSIDNSLPTTLVCEIENAVEYNWYKVAPTPRRQLVKSGNVLPFENIDDLDQGFYICTGTGGGLFMDRTVETKPALLTIAGKNIKKDFPHLFKEHYRIGFC